MTKILLIDDCEDIRDIYETLLEGEGIEVMAASCGQSGFNLYEEKEPAIILTDIIMPQMSGIEMIEKIRRNNKHIPIIAISGDPRQGSLSARAGANLFLEKPFCSKILVRNIKRHLQAKVL